MRKILFVSKTFNNFCCSHNANSHYIFDYYDIEVQKVINILGFSIKTSPFIQSTSSILNKTHVDKIYDLDQKRYISKFECGQTLGVVFYCL